MGGAINLSNHLPPQVCNRTLDKLATTHPQHTTRSVKSKKTTHTQND
jgi:hypothetical protein